MDNRVKRSDLIAPGRPRQRGAFFLAGSAQSCKVHDMPAYLQTKFCFKILHYVTKPADPKIHEAVAGFAVEPMTVHGCS